MLKVSKDIPLENLVSRQMKFWESVGKTKEKSDTPQVWPCITISREIGSQGAKLAMLLAERLGWQVFDKEIVDYIANHAKVRKNIVELFDGKGLQATCRIGSASKDALTADILDMSEQLRNTPLIHVALAPMKKDFDDTLVRLAELGVARVMPLVMRYGEVDPLRKGNDKFAERMHKLAVRAAKQSGLNHLLEVSTPIPVDALDGAVIVCDPDAGHSLYKLPLPSETDEIVLLVGPEGGFAEGEHATFENKGWQRAFLAGGVLRAGTAALAAASLIANRIRN